MSEPESKPKDDGYTIVDNYFLDKVMRKAGGVEWKVICTVIRDTVGWRRNEADIPIERFEEMTGARRSRLFEAITAACKRGVIKRPQQRSFRFRPLRKGNLHEVPKLDRRRRNQDPLPFSESENRTLENPKIGLCESENRTLEDPVLRSVKEIDLNTHTQSEESGIRDESPIIGLCEPSPGEAQSGVCADKPIDRARYKTYARAHPRIEDPTGWATIAERTLQWDNDVLEWEEAQRVEEAKRQEYERECAAEIEWQSLALREKPNDPERADQEALAVVPETAEQREARELREAADREAQQRGERIIAEVRERVEQRKVSAG
jgi:phage replication O-like protein O